MSEISLDYGAFQNLSMGAGGAALAALASSATVGWQSEIVDNRAELAPDYEVVFDLPMANTAPGSDKAVYIYCIPWFDKGSGGWEPGGDLGGTTAPSSTGPAACTIVNPPNMTLARPLIYTTTQQTLRALLNLTDLFGNCPEGFSFVIINFSGAAIGSSPSIFYRPIHPAI